jgi:hypothetical protein
MKKGVSHFKMADAFLACSSLGSANQLYIVNVGLWNSIMCALETERILHLGRLSVTPSKKIRLLCYTCPDHEVNLTEAEWLAGIHFLTATGQMCDDKRQEFILLSDTLGATTLKDMINHHKPPGVAEYTILGPFHRAGAPELPLGASLSERSSHRHSWLKCIPPCHSPSESIPSGLTA